MIIGLSIGAFTLLHVAITLVAIGSGLIVIGGMFASRRLPLTNALFLLTALTSVTGFLFPIHGFTPALEVGAISCVTLLVALFAYYVKGLSGAWRWIYVVTAIIALYFNAFVPVVQSFIKVAALNALAPTQSEPPFMMTQAAVLALFVLIGIGALICFRPNAAARSNDTQALGEQPGVLAAQFALEQLAARIFRQGLGEDDGLRHLETAEMLRAMREHRVLRQ
jgi:hypothetical protein